MIIRSTCPGTDRWDRARKVVRDRDGILLSTLPTITSKLDRVASFFVRPVGTVGSPAVSLPGVTGTALLYGLFSVSRGIARPNQGIPPPCGHGIISQENIINILSSTVLRPNVYMYIYNMYMYMHMYM